MSAPSAEDQLRFLGGIQRILDDGSFVATYKFALLMALADYAVKSGLDGSDPDSITTYDLAENFILSYWRQAMPYPSSRSDEPSMLRMSPGKPPVVFSRLIDLRKDHEGSLPAFRRKTDDWNKLKRKVADTIAKMPLWKLQVVGGQAVCLLYRQDGQGYQGNQMQLLPGVLYNLRHHFALVRNLVQGAWLRHVRRLNAVNLDEVDLDQFLFGTERSSWPTCLREVLRDVQKDTCLYCGTRVRDAGDIDHFIPWARYPLELGHNFVLAHATCNRSKSDLLAAPRHLASWHERNMRNAEQMGQAFETNHILHDYDATRRIVSWAYTLAESNMAHLWDASNKLMPTDNGWRGIIDHNVS